MCIRDRDNTDTINITGDMNVLELDLYDSLDDTVQDLSLIHI